MRCFDDLTLVCRSPYIARQEFFFSITTLCSDIGELHPLHEARCLKLLYCIVSDQIDQIDTHDDEEDEYVVKTRIQSNKNSQLKYLSKSIMHILHSTFFFLQYP